MGFHVCGVLFSFVYTTHSTFALVPVGDLLYRGCCTVLAHSGASVRVRIALHCGLLFVLAMGMGMHTLYWVVHLVVRVHLLTDHTWCSPAATVHFHFAKVMFLFDSKLSEFHVGLRVFVKTCQMTFPEASLAIPLPPSPRSKGARVAVPTLKVGFSDLDHLPAIGHCSSA